MEENQKEIRNKIKNLKEKLNSNITPEEQKKIKSRIKELKIDYERIEQSKIKAGKKQIEKERENLSPTEKATLKRLDKKEKKEEKKKENRPNLYIKISNKLFSNIAIGLFNENKLKSIEKDLLRSNMNITPTAYIAGVLTATMISFVISIFAVLFLTFFMQGEIILNLTKTFWLIFIVPFITFIGGYMYPSLEKGSVESNINRELPFATIHMSAISGSMLEPSKIFEIILSTKEYKTLEKELIKIMNGINIYGYNLVGSLKKTAERTASKKLAELFNSMSTTITSGGNLVEFFDKRSKSLLFDYKLERERKSKQAETFMDIYISVVIAAPMIFMLLLVMMQISGLGIEISNSVLTILMILGVGLINAIFIGFLYIRGS